MTKELKTPTEEEKINLVPIVNHIRKTMIELTELIISYNLPYELVLKFDMKHKNWKKVSQVHAR